MVDNIGWLIWLSIVTLFSVSFAFINLKFLHPFWKHKNVQYLQRRKPILLFIYCILSSFVLLIIIPNICIAIYIQSLHETKSGAIDSSEWWVTYYFAFDSVYGSIFCTFINIIAIRVWLLYYDHEFANATVDRIWRNVINPTDENFFLSKRNTLGNDKFLIKLLFTIWIVLILIILTFVILFITPSTNTFHGQIDEYLFLTLRIFLAVPISIFIFTVYRKIKTINDEFKIRKEMQYLSYLAYFVILTSIIAILLLAVANIPIHIFESITYSFDVIFIFSSCYIQTKWVLNEFIQNLNKVRSQKSKQNATENKLGMVDILRNKTSFEAFMVLLQFCFSLSIFTLTCL